MKIVGYSNRTFEIRTNPHDGIFVEILPETQDEKALFGEGALKIYERSVNYVADRSIPWDGGENSGWRLLVEYLGGGDVFWERVREKHEEYKREAKQKRKELARKMATEVANGQFRAFRKSSSSLISVIPNGFTEYRFLYFPNQKELEWEQAFTPLRDFKMGKVEELQDKELLQKIRNFYASKL